MTVSGGGRSYGVLGEGNKQNFDNGTLQYDVNQYSVRRKKQKTKLLRTRDAPCDNSYQMISIVPLVDASSTKTTVELDLSV